MFSRLGRFAAHRPRSVLIATALFVIFGGIWGSGAFGQFAGGAGFDDPHSESAHANELLAGPLGRNATDVVVMYTNTEMTVDDPRFEAAVTEAAARIPDDAVTRVDTYYKTGSADLVSADRHSTYIGMQLAEPTEEANVTLFQDEIENKLDVAGFETRYGGLVPVNSQVNALTMQDIARGEMISIPILMILLVIIFRSVIAASLPLIVGTVVAVGSLGVLRVVGMFYDVTAFSINVVTMLGLGLAIDYGLLVVNRFREELEAGRSVPDAVVATMGSAGRTVGFSGLAIAATLIGLLIIPSRFMVSMAWTIVAVVLFAVLAVSLVLPAMLSLVGHRVNSLRMPLPRWRREPVTATAHGGWYRTAKAIMRRPLAITAIMAALLVLAGTPLLGAQWGRPSDWVLPAGVDSRVVDDMLDNDFVRDPTEIVTVVVEMPDAADSAESTEALSQFAGRLDNVPGVDGAAITGTSGDMARLTLGYAMDPQSDEARTMVEALRAETPPAGATVWFTNYPVSLADMLTMLAERLPWLALYVSIVSFIVLFLAFGSVTIPVLSLALNALSLSAAFGAIALIFQHGFAASLLGFIPEGFMDANMPMLIFVIAFGLAMDYQVFTLSRIKEQWDRTHDVEESIAVGVQSSARIISSAAVLFVVVVAGFMFSRVTFMQMIGVGLVIAVIIDASLVRGVLVPATLRLLGAKAWWAPKPMAKWWQRWGMPEPTSAPAPLTGAEHPEGAGHGAGAAGQRLGSEPERVSVP